MDRVAFDFGIVQIYWYSICIFVAMTFGCAAIYREAKRRQIDESKLGDLIFNTLINGIIGARLYYVAFNWSYYMSNPIEIFQIWKGGLAIHGGLILGFISIILFCLKNKINVMRMLDIIVVGLILGQSIGRWGNFFNGEAYGAITTLKALQAQGIPQFIIDGMYIMGQYRQPTFLYESIGCLAGFFALIIIRFNKYLKRGTLTGIYLVWYGILRLFIEKLRSDSLMLGSIKMAQLVSIAFIIIGAVILIINIFKKSKDKNLYRKDPEEVKREKALNK